MPNVSENRRNPYSSETSISAPVQEPVKKNPFGENQSFSSIVETINNFNIDRAKSHPFVPYPEEQTSTPVAINYAEIMKSISDAFTNNSSLINLFSRLNDIFVKKQKWNFIGFGLLHEKSKCLNIRLYSKAGNSYNSKVFLSDETNPIVQCFNSKQ